MVREGETAASINGQYGYDNEGRLTSGDGFTYVYDTMGRTSQMRQQVDDTLFASATYGVAGEMLTMSWPGITETRTYNERLQLTRQRAVSALNVPGLDVEYRFPTGTNNGRITSQKENVSGEEITYQYDELNRLIAAVTTGPEWGLSFAYDGFGNRTAQTVTKGTAPQVTLAYNGTTNRISTPGWSYDANGNVTAMPTVATMNYDGYNRLSWSGPSTENYAYAPDNKRVWREIVGEREELTYYNVAGQRITTYRLYWNGASWQTEPISTNIYFTGRLIWTAGQPVVTDRLGSVRRRMDPNSGYWGEQLKYFPYGEEQVATASNKEKFGTYTRDQRTNLDYADQRYYSSGFGRFMTPDPFKPGAGLDDPASWNQYSYTGGEPVNRTDPTGEFWVSMGTFSLPGGTISLFGWVNSPIQHLFVPVFYMLTYAPPLPSPVVANPAQTRVTSKTQAGTATRAAIDGMSGKCASELKQDLNISGDVRNALKDKSTTEMFWDARSPGGEGAIWADVLVPGAPHAQLYSAGTTDTQAFVIEANGRQTGNVVLKNNFFTADRAEQDITLIHELLHVYSNKNDDNLAKALGVFDGSSRNSSSRITAWLRGDCSGKLVF